jgi:N-acetylglucosaminyldiphosphoundecaprenol N-acetyl-beta-D-mannosaminyltransferase
VPTDRGSDGKVAALARHGTVDGSRLDGLLARVVGGRSLLTSDAELDALIGVESAVRVQTVNLHHVFLGCTDDAAAAAMDAADYVTLDGRPLVWLAHRRLPACERVTGREFIERLAAGRTSAKVVALIGAGDGAAAAFGSLLEAHGVQLALHVGGAAADWDLDDIAGRVQAVTPDVVLVAVTPPRGELVAAGLRTRLSRGLVIQVGGAINMVTGRRRPPPSWVGAAGLEWLWRFALEPRRLFVRYFWESPIGLVAFARALRRADD